MDILLLILGLVLILGGANYLTDGSAIVAQRFRIPEFIIGLTVIAVGTSTPELVVSVLSAIAGNSDVAIGNIVGSNIFNVFVILGICTIIAPIALTSSNIRRDIPIGLAVSLLLFVITSDRLLHLGITDQIGRGEGLLMIAIYIGVMWYTIRTSPRPSQQSPDHVSTEKNPAWWLSVVMILGGLGALVAGGELFLRGATQVARDLGVSESVIAITLVAGGTSLPELASSLVSLMKGKAEMALGNVIGSNIANILLILGISSTIHPLTMGGITPTDIGMVVLSSVALFVTAFTFRRRAIDRWEGIIFVAIYATYIFYLLK
ncbi:MAG: calcium/sodium antiporter [Alistipes sp.]